MSESLNHFKTIIRSGNYDNTYKMAWAKAIVEYALTHKDDELKDEYVEITLFDIGKNMLKYYWNQTVFFDLIQGSNVKKPPVLLQKTKKLIDTYFNAVGSKKPVFFDKASYEIEIQGPKIFDGIPAILKENVSYRFLLVDGHIYDDVYRYKKNDDSLFMKKELFLELADNHEDLFDLINYRWSLILETFNSSPRINKKVRIMDEREIRRKSALSVFDKFLDYENKEHICFICGKKIEEGELSRDHVIPWSYLYSDDLWNLVYVHDSCNSSKSNTIPSEETIKHLKKRNETLLKALDDNNVKGKAVDELRLAIDRDLVDKFYIGSKG